MRVSIVILNWNRPKDTIDCLESICEMSFLGLYPTVVLVDNASTDDSLDKIRNWASKRFSTQESLGKRLEFKILKNKENLGFAQGNNVGILYSLERKSDFILLINNDTYTDKNMLKYLLDTAKVNSRVGAISPKIYFAKGYEFHKGRYRKSELGRVIWYAGGNLDWDNVLGLNRGVDEVDHGQYDEISETDFATGACMLLRSTALREVGLFDQRYFMYFEDVDLSQRLKAVGWKVMYDFRAKLWHKVAQSSKIGGDLNDYFITRNRLLFGFKYARPRTKLAILKESFRILFSGRRWQKRGVIDFYLRRLGKGRWS